MATLRNFCRSIGFVYIIKSKFNSRNHSVVSVMNPISIFSFILSNELIIRRSIGFEIKSHQIYQIFRLRSCIWQRWAESRFFWIIRAIFFRDGKVDAAQTKERSIVRRNQKAQSALVSRRWSLWWWNSVFEPPQESDSS
jgi:hypothetical protein